VRVLVGQDVPHLARPAVVVPEGEVPGRCRREFPGFERFEAQPGGEGAAGHGSSSGEDRRTGLSAALGRRRDGGGRLDLSGIPGLADPYTAGQRAVEEPVERVELIYLQEWD
jgi:hypothetical protein